jgi:birA, biotin-[acetyl-CoA-carboxylase] ligase region
MDPLSIPLTPWLRLPHNFRIIHLPICSSTQDEARKLYQSGHPLVVTTDQQTAGRGRRGRSWTNGKGNFLASFALPLTSDVAPFAMMVLAVELATFLQNKITADIRVKWPNDIMVEGQKISGIIGEYEQQLSCLILGVGVNLHSSPELRDGRHEATSLAEQGFGQDIHDELLDHLCSSLSGWMKENTPTEHVVSKLESLSFPKGSFVRLLSETSSLEGAFDGLTKEGHLKLLDANNTQHVIMAGDVVQCRWGDQHAFGH